MTGPAPYLSHATAPVKVMLVDDSSTVRSLIARAISSDGIEIMATAADGEAAVAVAGQCRPQIIVLDIEMPKLDGLAALPQLLKAAPGARVIMASTLTLRNADISLKALKLGACDYVPKPSASDAHAFANFGRELREKILALAPRAASSSGNAIFTAPLNTPMPGLKALAFASSTGGPQALMTVLEGLRGKFLSVPIFITQHMPPVLTTILARQLEQASGRPCHECKGGERVEAGHIYLAPGDFHLTVDKMGDGHVIRTRQDPPENFCRPSADPMLRSLCAAYGRNLMAIVLTGMGSDGLEGAKTVARAGGEVIAQDESTSIVWGMPRAVAEQKICRAVLPLEQIAPYLIEAADASR